MRDGPVKTILNVYFRAVLCLAALAIALKISEAIRAAAPAVGG